MSGFYDPVVYDARAEGVPGDVEFFLGLARKAHEAEQPVLELACGTGRVTIPIARQGIQIVGLDQSPAMLDRAREKSAGLDTVRWVEGDMRHFELPERFGLAFIPYRSFHHLMTVDDQLACLSSIREHLVPGGRLAIDIFNPNIVTIGRWLTTKRGSLERRRDDYEHPETGRATKRWETRAYRTAKQEVESTFLDEELDQDSVVVSRIYRDLRLRYTFRYEMQHLLERSGFEIEALCGDFVGGAFEDTSPEMVWVARRPE
jgi:SAM-dependent methyltransferase